MGWGSARALASHARLANREIEQLHDLCSDARAGSGLCRKHQAPTVPEPPAQRSSDPNRAHPPCRALPQTGNFSIEFPALPADFGPEIPPTGVSGLLVAADPEDGYGLAGGEAPAASTEGSFVTSPVACSRRPNAWLKPFGLATLPDRCEPLVPPPWAAHRAWVALIARSQDKDGCTFDVKVRWCISSAARALRVAAAASNS